MGSDKNSVKVNALALFHLLNSMHSKEGEEFRRFVAMHEPSGPSAFGALGILTAEYNEWAQFNTPPKLVEWDSVKPECAHHWAYDENGPNYDKLRNANFCLTCGMHRSFVDRPSGGVVDLKTFVETGGLTRDQLSDGLKSEMEQTEPSTGTESTAGPQCGHAVWCSSRRDNQVCNCIGKI